MSKTKRFIYLFLGVLVLLNIMIVLSGKSYLYKGIKETYLKGKSGPGIYDSLVFANRLIPASNHKHSFQYSDKDLPLTEKENTFLNTIETTSFLVIKNGKIITEKYWGNHQADTKSNSFSMAKSVVGLLIGIAKDKGYIQSFDEPISNYIDYFGETKVTIRHLLTMSSDLNWRESGKNPLSENAAAYYGSNLENLVRNLSFGTNTNMAFAYASGNSQLLGFILKEATGLSLSDFMSQEIWSKIGSEHPAFWSLDSKDGMEKTFCCMYATSRDYAKLGQLILQNGLWENEVIIQPSTIKELTKNAVFEDENTNLRYGMHFWLTKYKGNRVIYFRGILGQYIIAIPNWDMIIVRTGHKRLDKIEPTQVSLPSHKEFKYKIDHPADLFEYLEMGERRK